MSTDAIQISVSIGAATREGYDKFKTIEDFKARLEKKLTKKGKQVVWVVGSAPVELGIYIEPGSQMMRYLIPFSSPAKVEVRGKWTAGPGREHQLNSRGAAHFGLFGGTPQGMLKVAANTAADRMAKQLLAASAV